MADFFKKIGDGFTKAANNVKDTVETSRKRGDLKKQISDAKNNIKSIEIAMGEAIYNAYKNGGRPESFADNCKEIDNLQVEIKVLRAKLLELDGIKILGNGELTKALTVKATVFSATAKEKIEAAGGKIEEV